MHPLDAPGALWVLSRAGKVPRPPAGGRNLSQETAFLRQAGKGPTFLFPVSQRVSPQRRRPGGFPVAPWTPSGPIPIYVGETSHKEHVPCGGQGKVPSLLSCFAGNFASAEATRGLSDRPLETFGADVRNLPQITDFLWKAGGKERCSFFLFRRGFRLCGGDQGAFRSPPGPLRVNMLWRST